MCRLMCFGVFYIVFEKYNINQVGGAKYKKGCIFCSLFHIVNKLSLQSHDDNFKNLFCRSMKVQAEGFLMKMGII